MNVLTKEQILAADDLKIEPVEVPEWGGSVCVRTMTGKERELYERRVTGPNPSPIPLLVAMTACDESGAPIFAEADVEALAGKSVQALYRVFSASQKLNKIATSDVEDAAKN